MGRLSGVACNHRREPGDTGQYTPGREVRLTTWLAARRRNREMANAAATLVEENERLRSELASANRSVERCHEVLAVLIDAVEKVDAIRQKGDAA